MHWAHEIAEELIKNKPEKEEFVLASGITPSGTVHIGNFREFITTYFVAKALRQKGKKTKTLHSWDEYDRFRKVPKTIPENRREEFENYIGKPCSEVPDPFGCHASYSQHYEKEFEDAIAKLDLHIDFFRYQSKEYTSGRYKEGIVTALLKRKEIFDILDSFRTQEAGEGERNNYYPISVYCRSCGKDDTTIEEVSDDCRKVKYSCKCGHAEEMDLDKDFNVKLAWKVDWPMRWKEEGVDFEPGGKDHSAPQSSYQASKIIVKKIYGVNEPMYRGYEFIGIKGLTGKMSSSSGLNISPDELSRIYPKEMILWMYAKKEPNEAFEVSLGEDVPRIYGEFDKVYNKYFDDRANLDQKSIEVFDLILEENASKCETVPFNILATMYSVANGRVEVIEEMFEKIGMNYKYEQFKDRMEKVSHWLNTYAQDSIVKLNVSPDFEHFYFLEENAKAWVRGFYNLMETDPSLEVLSTKLYDIPKDPSLDEKGNKANQLSFFKTIYKLLIGKDRGPMLSTLIMVLGAKNILPIIEPLLTADYSTMVFEKEEEKEEKFKMKISENIVAKYGKVKLGVVRVDNFSMNSEFKGLMKQKKNESIEFFNKLLQQYGSVENVPVVKNWRNIFAKMGCNETKVSSIENLYNLMKFKGKLPDINPIVDYYNAISCMCGIPMGAYDYTKLEGSELTLREAKAEEEFLPMCSDKTEVTDAGEVIYADAAKVTCRYWNNKDSEKTKITKESKQVLFFFDVSPEVSSEDLKKIVENFVQELKNAKVSDKINYIILDENNLEAII